MITVFTDLDDTLYNWVDVFARSFQAMVNTLSRITALDNETIIESFARVYKERKSLEYSFAIQELDIWKSLKWSMDKIKYEAVRPARLEFSNVRNMNLKLFPDVRDTLKWANQNDVHFYAISMAPDYQAHKRLRHFRLDIYFDGLLVFLGYEIPKYAPDDVVNKADKSPSSIKFTKVYENLRKPEPTPILETIDQFKLDPKKTFLIGDSIDQDVYMAQKAGIIDIWARYGKQNINPNSLEIIRRISTRTAEEIQRSEEIRKNTIPTHTIDSFSSLRDVIDSYLPKQLDLPF